MDGLMDPLAQPPQQLADGRTWDDLLGAGPDLSPAEVVEDARHLLGIGARRVRYGDGLPDVSGLAEGMDLG